MMRTILLNLPWKENGRLGVRAGSRWPFTSLPEKDGRIHYLPFPFFLAYASALLKKNNKEVRLIDAIAQELSEQELIEELLFFNPGLIAIETSTPSFPNDMSIIKNIHLNLPDCQIALCGPHVSAFPEDILNNYKFVDYILMGEFEYILLDLANHLENRQDPSHLPGLAYRQRGRVRVNRLRPAIDNLDDLPWPERESLPMYKYNDGFCDLPQPNVQMWASRGCPYQCTFCLWPQTIYKEHRFRKRNPTDIVDEMEYLVNRFGFKAVYFDDDVFNIDRSHVASICKEIVQRKIKIPWAAMARADLMDEGLLEDLTRAGLYAVKYGIESADNGILNLCKKNMDLEKALDIIRITKETGVRVHLTFCLGLPGETKETVQKTADFIREARPDSLQFSFATPFPGTDYFKYVDQRGDLVSKHWPDYDGNARCIVKTEELTSNDLEEIRFDLSSHLNLQ